MPKRIMEQDKMALALADYDVAIIGAGMNGASAAQQLSAAGYSVVILDKNDFGSGATGKSGRLLHCGLRYLEPGKSVWDFVLNPLKFAVALRMARQGMVSRADFVQTTPERATPYKAYMPVYRNQGYSPWQVKLAFALLSSLGPKSVPLDFVWHDARAASSLPIVDWTRNKDGLIGVAEYREYVFDWPERICVDLVLDAERLGAVAMNYTEATQIAKDGAFWHVNFRERSGTEGRIRARTVLNMAGAWIDQVNARTASGASRLIRGTKGTHIMVRFPERCRGISLYTYNRLREGYVITPFRDMHQIGPTETLYEGDMDDVAPTEDEIDFLIAESNHIFPNLRLGREHVLYAWAGIRPLGYDPAYPKGKRSRDLHDLSADGLDGIFTMTGGPVMTHRSAGAELVKAVASRIKPSGTPKQLSNRAHPIPDPLSNSDSRLDLEQATNLVDYMFRRIGAGWSPDMGQEIVGRVAAAISDAAGWSRSDMEAAIGDYHRYLAIHHRVATEAVGMVDAPRAETAS